MEVVALWLLGLEVTGFVADDAVAPVLGSLASVQSGSFSLSPYDGPAIQPTLALHRGALEIGVAPGLSVRREQAADGDGSTATASAVQWRGELRLRRRGEVGLFGLDTALSSGRASLSGEVITTGPLTVALSPTVGAHAPLSDRLSVVGRVRWPITLSEGTITSGPGGAVALEWAL